MEKLPTKSSESYLESLNGYPEEKIGFILEAIEKGKLPLCDEKYRVLEIGPGGGSSVELLRQQTQSSDMPVEIHCVDALESPLSSVKAKDESYSVVIAEGQHLPFVDSTMSAVNTSAVLHEVSSYGHHSDQHSDINHSISEISRVLATKGLWAYRDMGAPIEGLLELRENEYTKGSVVAFIKKFLPDFLEKGTLSHKEYQDSISIQQNGDSIFLDNAEQWSSINIDRSLTISALSGLLREIERHYIVYLKDLLSWNTGISLEQDVTKGGHVIRLDPDSPYVNLQDIDFQPLEYLGDDRFVVTSDTYHTVLDDIAKNFLDGVDHGDESANDKFDAYVESEGSEYYFYYNLSQLILTTAKLSLEQSGEHVLLPENISDIVLLERPFSDSILQTVSENPLPDTKQLVAFKKLLVEQAKEVIIRIKHESKELLEKVLGAQYPVVLEQLEALVSMKNDPTSV